MKLKNWAENWLEVYVKNRVKLRTYEKYKQLVSQHILPYLGKSNIRQIKSSDIQKLIYTDLFKRKRLSGNTVNVVLAVLRLIFATAFDAGIINKNPCIKVKRVAVEEKAIGAFTKREQDLIERAVFADGRCRMYGIVICLYTGIRIGELLSLTWQDIDFINRTMHVNKTLAPLGAEKSYSSPKTRSSVRVLPIPPNLYAILKSMKSKSSSEWVIEYNGKQVSERAYQGLFERLQKRLNIAPRGFHSLRHTFATRAVECGTDYKTLSELMGHKNAMITINRYAHSLMETKRRAINRIAKTE